jgi:hypothetical protein
VALTMRQSLAPSERTARTKTSSRTDSTDPRTTRAKIGVNTTPIAIITLSPA